jgi:hypothetical protein
LGEHDNSPRILYLQPDAMGCYDSSSQVEQLISTCGRLEMIGIYITKLEDELDVDEYLALWDEVGPQPSNDIQKLKASLINRQFIDIMCICVEIY